MIVKCLFAVLVASLVSAGRVPGPEERILGGYFTYIENAPYQISLLLNDVHNCGGAIYSKRIVLTAAHCVAGRKAEDLSVRAGSTLRHLGGQVVKVLKAYPHKDYNRTESGFSNDIAVLYLKKSLKLNSPKAKKIELATKTPKTGENCTVTGWGITYTGSYLGAPSLLAANLTISNHTTCRQKYFFGVDKGMICAEAAGQDSCKGDSGGPLVSEPDRKLIGIVSWGNGCGNDKYPGVYASVAYYKDWILKAVEIVQK